MTGWRIVTDPQHGLTLHVPTVAHAGAAVEVQVDQDAIEHRIARLDRRWIGGRRRDRVVRGDRRPRRGVRGAAGSFARPIARGAHLGAVPGHDHRPDCERPSTSPARSADQRARRFIFVDSADRTVRIIMDPTSPTNVAILDTLELARRFSSSGVCDDRRRGLRSRSSTSPSTLFEVAGVAILVAGGFISLVVVPARPVARSSAGRLHGPASQPGADDPARTRGPDHRRHHPDGRHRPDARERRRRSG